MRKYLALVSIFASILTASAITLSWDASPSGDLVQGYKIYQSTTAAGPFTLVGSTTNLNYFINYTPGAGCWYVTATNLVSESPPSTIACTPPVSTAPKNPAFLSWSNGILYLSWSPNASIETITGYAVYQSTSSAGPFTQVATTTTPSVGLTLAPGVYYIRVTALNFWGESVPSATLVTPKSPGQVNNLRITK